MKARDESAKKKKRPDKGVSLSELLQNVRICVKVEADMVFWIQIDMEKLAENMQKMTEDDLLLVVQMIHDNKTADTWTKNDVDRKCSIYMPTWYVETNKSPQRVNSKWISTRFPIA